ncbi:hypothetical protein [Pseudonocardia acidicola]|uniref:Bacterial transcriptional activator domain-containing protein n=1 Tax=Pseudonocardia acidicola TaxID=2724939 RepID=A0ABX1SKN0_9PSEU|nr:hypothetical protein [Pseudonocardia acidicola]NMI02111.1 hypothetical protein [Pseudonocardia acidicola]
MLERDGTADVDLRATALAGWIRLCEGDAAAAGAYRAACRELARDDRAADPARTGTSTRWST